MANNYLFGGGAPWTYEQLQRRREIAKSLMSKGTPRNVGEGLSALGGDIAGALLQRAADKREAALRDEAMTSWGDFFGNWGGDTSGGGTSAGAGAGYGATSAVDVPSAKVDPSSPQGIADDTMRALEKDPLGPSATLIQGFEGFRDTPYWDVNALRAGYGSDTVTTADGQVVPVTDSTRVSREDATRDLKRRISAEFMPAAASAVGEDVFGSLTPEQQAVLTSLSYNYGAGAWQDDLADVARAVRSGDMAAATEAINALGSHNNGINQGRRSKEAALFSQSAGAGGSTQPLGMIGGVKPGGGYWQPLDGDGTAHAANPNYSDYSQLYREYTFDQKPGYVPVGERNGRTVYAAPDYMRGEDGNYMPVSAADVQRIAAENGALVPTREEVTAMLEQAQNIPMPTQNIGETGGSGDPAAYTAAVTAAMNGIEPNTPIAHGKEFYAPSGASVVSTANSTRQPPAGVPQAPTGAPAPTPAGGSMPPANMQTLMKIAQFANNPMLPPGQRMVAQALMQRMTGQMFAPPQQPEWSWNPELGRYVDLNGADLGKLRAPEEPGYSIITGERAASMGLDPNAAYNVGPDGRVKQIGGGGTSVTVNNGGAPGLGKLSSDYGYVLDPETQQPRIDPETGLPTAAPIPGSPAAQEIAANEEAAAKADEQEGTSASLVMDEINIARDIIKSDPNITTGVVGGLLSNVDSTKAGALKNRLMTIKANISFDKLQDMRDASPTGGALGQVSDFENRLLQAVFGSLEQSQSKEDLLYNLDRLEKIYSRIINEGIPDDEARQMYQEIVTGEEQPDPTTPPSGSLSPDQILGVIKTLSEDEKASFLKMTREKQLEFVRQRIGGAQ